MTNYFRVPTVWLTAVVLLFPAIGCQNMNHTQAGAVVGSTFGALTGAAIGQHSGKTGEGALVGALAGGLLGGLAGNGEDMREQRDDANARAFAAEQQRQEHATALTNYDLIKMAQSGVGDDVIVQSVRSRGGRFDLSPDALISLNQSGVSDKVLVEIQKIGEAPPPTTVVAGAGYPYATQVVVVRPQPAVRFGVVVGPRRSGVVHHHHHRWGPRRRWR